MSHMVIYRGADGKPGYQQAEDIHDAVTFVEQMRNTDGVEHARIFRLEEVVFEYRPYYRVEIASSAPQDPMVTAGVASNPMVIAAPAPTPPAATPPAKASAPAKASSETPDEPPVVSLGEPFEVVDSTTINVDDPDPEAVASNGARRGLFGR